MGWFGNGSDSLRLEMTLAAWRVSRGEGSELVDDFGVSSGKGNGVVAGVKRGGLRKTR